MTMKRKDSNQSVIGRLSVLLALLVLSSCLRTTQSHQSGSLHGGFESHAGTDIALSGNGEPYPGPIPRPTHVEGFERSPGFKCGNTLLGYGSSLVVGNGISLIWSTDPCDPASAVVFHDSVDFNGATDSAMSSVSGFFFSALGRIYEVVDQNSPGVVQGTYRTETWCQSSDSNPNATEVTIQLDPSTGARTAIIYLLWADDPKTHEPVPTPDSFGLPYYWRGHSDTFPVTRIDSGVGTDFTQQNFSLELGAAPDSTKPYRRPAHLKVTFYGLESAFDLSCVWAGK
jgi:hypothetical protein